MGNTGRSRGPVGVGTLPAGRGGTLGRNRWCGCSRLIHCLNAVLPPSSVPPSSSSLGIHLSPPGPGSNDLRGGKERVQRRKESFSNDYLLVVSCILESSVPLPPLFSRFWSRDEAFIS